MTSAIYFQPESATFVDLRLSGSDVPPGAIAISAALHRKLLDGQAEGGRIVAGPDGRPRLHLPAASERRAALRKAIRSEAQRRCLTVSPLWRQINDLRLPSAAGDRRFARIDAIRAASAEIEAAAATRTASEIDDFPVRDHPIWPKD